MKSLFSYCLKAFERNIPHCMFYSYFQYFSFAVPLFVVVIIVGGGGDGVGGVSGGGSGVEVQVEVDAVRWWYDSTLYGKLCIEREMHG